MEIDRGVIVDRAGKPSYPGNLHVGHTHTTHPQGKPPIPLPEKILSLLATAASILPEPYLTPDGTRASGSA